MTPARSPAATAIASRRCVDGGLAVRAGDAEAPHRPRRVPVQAGGGRAEGLADARDPGLGDAEVEVPLDEQGDRAAADGGRRVVVAVGHGARDAGEARSRADGPAVVRERRDVDARVTPELEHARRRRGARRSHAAAARRLLLGPASGLD